MKPATSVCMLVYNVCTRDARVLKEATSLTAAGAAVTVVAVLSRDTAAKERRDGFTIVRIDRNPPHYRLLRGTRRLRRQIEMLPRRARLATNRRHARLVRGAARRRPAKGGRPAAAGWRRRTRRIPTAPLAVLLWVLLGLERLAIAAVRAINAVVAPLGYRAVMTFHKPLLFADYYRQACRLIAAADFDVVHAHDLNTLPAAWLAARRTGVRVIYDSHELYTEISTLSRRERAIWRLLERRMIRTPERVVTVCDSIADELQRRYPIARPAILLNCPPRALAAATVDRTSSPLRGLLPDVRDETPIVIYQGGFAPNRGLAELVLAGGMLERGVLVLMGWGQIEAELRGLIASNGLGERVLVVPPVAQGEVVAYAAGADVGVIPYQPIGLNNRYTTPNKLFDYMAAGIAVAGTRLPELERFVERLALGALFDAVEPELIAATLNELLDDPSRLAECRRRSREAGRTYTWERETDKLLELYGLSPAVASGCVTEDDPAEAVPSAASTREDHR
jgi:glycosyltransferase involved in cell wall biosynthesis